jgi:hypothetical protein
MDFRRGDFMLKIDWALGWGNLPSLVIEEDLALIAMDECEFQFNNGIWYHIQKNGLVRYFAHSGRDVNEGGFGGAVFNFLYNGKPHRVVGPWSSRASALNTRLPEEEQVADIKLINTSKYPTHCGILISELVTRWNSEDAYLLRALNRYSDEHGPVTASLANDCIKKPDGFITDQNYEYQIFAEPTNV